MIASSGCTHATGAKHDMSVITVYGASDDLIEIEGAIREEFSAIDAAPGHLLAFSDGTVLSVRYGREGLWRIAPVCRGAASLNIRQTSADDPDGYTDRATLSMPDGDAFRWAVFATEIAQPD
jgi:hypothetical protein